MQRTSTLARAIAIFCLAGLCDTALVLALYLRPSPFGPPYVLDVSHYLGQAIVYGWYGIALLSLPFVLLARRVRVPWFPALHVGVLATSLVVSQLDHALQRFMGAHPTFDLFRAYGRVAHMPSVMWGTLARDRGGAYSDILLLLVPVLFVVLALRVSATVARHLRVSRQSLAWGAVVLVAVPALFWHAVPGGCLRREKVKPATYLAVDVLAELAADARAAPSIRDEVAAYQAAWLAEESDPAWRFIDPEQPLLRERVRAKTSSAVAHQPNIVLVVLETFRAKNMAAFNPRARTGVTPFLDSLARDPAAARWPRFYANGVPSVFAFMTIHTGLLPHSRRRVATAFTHVNLEGVPAVVRRAGYHAAFFTASDPDWDNQRLWAERWYDEVHFDPRNREHDRSLFRSALARMRELGAAEQPFFATVVSISNHTPFVSPEPALDLDPDCARASSCIRNTMHYTDDVVRELVDGLRHEPWFDDTVIIVTGDHGIDLGERGEVQGHGNLRHETTWVPLIVYGRDSRLPRGRQDRVASHVDLGPTIVDLAGAREPIAMMGHSLLDNREGSGSATTVRFGNLAHETNAFALYAPSEGTPHLYWGDDVVQHHDVAQRHPDVVEAHLRVARRASRVADHAIEHGTAVTPVHRSAGAPIACVRWLCP